MYEEMKVQKVIVYFISRSKILSTYNIVHFVLSSESCYYLSNTKILLFSISYIFSYTPLSKYLFNRL